MSAGFGSEDKMVNIETWRAVHILRGHTGGQSELILYSALSSLLLPVVCPMQCIAALDRI